jgi:hypothetical protein
VYTLFVPPPPTPVSHLPPGRTNSAFLVSDFVKEKNMKDKKNMAFLLV